MLPRQDMYGWDWDNMTTSVPGNAAPLTGGSAFLDGDIVSRSGLRIPNTYTLEQPVRNTYADDTPTTYGANHGYASLYDNPLLVQSIDAVSRAMDVPPHVLADVLAYTSSGTFASSDVSPVETARGTISGIFPFNRSEALDVDADPLSLTPDQQVRLLLPERLSRVRASERTPHNTFASVLLGNNADLLSEYVANPRKGDLIHNGVKTLNTALSQLGVHASRQYRTDSINPRRMRQQSIVHTEHRQGCRWCQVISNSNTPFTPHEAQY